MGVPADRRGIQLRALIAATGRLAAAARTAALLVSIVGYLLIACFAT
jgi:hypothetical protein